MEALSKYLAQALQGSSGDFGGIFGQLQDGDSSRFAETQRMVTVPTVANTQPEEWAPQSKPSPQAAPMPAQAAGAPARAAKFQGATPLDASPELYDHISKVEKQYGLPSGVLVALKDKGEKSGSNATSPVGAMGIFQFMPTTWKQYGGDTSPRDPFASANAAGKFMKDLLKMYDGNVAAAIAHYNGGTRQGKLVASGKEPTFDETRNYVRRVLT